MVKRVVSLLAAVFMVCASSFSVSAWSADSFVADSSNYYKLFPLNSTLSSAFTSSSDSDSMSFDELFGTSTLSSSMWVYFMGITPEYTIGVPPYEVTVPESPFVESVPDVHAAGLSMGDPEVNSSYPNNVNWFSDYVTVPETPGNGSYYTDVRGPLIIPYSHTDGDDVTYWNVDFDLDLSKFGSFSTFDLYGKIVLRGYMCSSSDLLSVNMQTMDLIVNGSSVSSFTASNGTTFDVPHTVITVPSSVDSVTLRFTYVLLSDVAVPSVGQQWRVRWYAWAESVDVGLTFDVLSGDAALDGFTDEAQDSINQHDQIEADWVGQMDENFNSLDLDTASYPSGLVSGFQLLSGIFMDIWNGLGDLHLIFTIPLTLGIVLVLIGRISKAVSNRSGRAEEKGDNSA